MRLAKSSEIKALILSFDPSAEVYLFGSRTDDTALGGDVDLLVLSGQICLRSKLKILTGIYDLIGEQKVDMIIAKDLSNPFHQFAFNTGLRL